MLARVRKQLECGELESVEEDHSTQYGPGQAHCESGATEVHEP